MFKTFLSRKFFSLLLSSTIGQLVITVLTLSDSMIAGVMLGEDAVAAPVSVVSGVTSNSKPRFANFLAPAEGIILLLLTESSFFLTRASRVKETASLLPEKKLK